MSNPNVRRRDGMELEAVTADEDSDDYDQQLVKAEMRRQRDHERRRTRKRERGWCCCCCCSMKQCYHFLRVCIKTIVIVLPLVCSLLMFYELIAMREELKEEREKRRQVEEVRLRENELQAAGARWLQQCIGQRVGDYDSFTGVRLFWGLIEFGYTTKQQLRSCITEYNENFSRKLSLY